jgi:hypothetical protein
MKMLWFNSNENRLNRASNKTISIIPLGNKDYSLYRQQMKKYDRKDAIYSRKNNQSNVKSSSLLIEWKENFGSTDLGIVPIKQNFVMASRSRAFLRCVWIKHAASQTVIFWCGELDIHSYNAQMIISLEIQNKKHWVINDIPFADAYNAQGRKLVLYQNNHKVLGFIKNKGQRDHGIFLFHYTTSTIQTKPQMLDVGYKIALEVNKVSEVGGFYNVTLEINDDFFPI